MDLKLIGLVGLSFLISYFLVPPVKKLAFKVGALDHPGGRKIHKKVTPYLGGVPIFLGFAIPLLIISKDTRETLPILLGGVIVLAVGVWDDFKKISPLYKVIVEVVASLILIYFGIRIQFVGSPLDGLFYLGNFSIPLTILWVVGVTNAINLIDGLDGLAAGVSVISLFVMAVASLMVGRIEIIPLILILAASTAGFLRYNFHPASIFMGDSGSLFLGFSVAAISVMGTLKSAATFSLLVPIIILAIPIFDTFLAILRRARNRRSIFKPDREHFHHKLVDFGLSQKQTVIFIYFLNFALGLVGLLTIRVSKTRGILVFLAAVLVLIWIGISCGATKKPKE